MAHSRIITGAHVLCYVNGKPFGRVTNFTFAASSPSEEIGGVDSGELFELAPTTSRVQGTVGLYRTIADGGLEGAGIAAPSGNLPRAQYFSVMLIERLSRSIIFEARQCRVESQSWPVATKSQVVGSFTFKALSWSNEVRPA